MITNGALLADHLRSTNFHSDSHVVAPVDRSQHEIAYCHDEMSVTVGRRVRDHRLNRGMSPEALGARVGVSGMTIRRIEEGRNATVRTKFLIARELDLEVVDLFGRR